MPAPARYTERMAGRAAALLIAALAAHGGAWAQSPEPAGAGPKTVAIVHVDTAPVLDGRLDDEVWSQAAVIDDLHQIAPVEYEPSSEYTRIRLLYTDEALYVGAELRYQDTEQVSAKVLRQGESFFGDDLFGVLLDPFHDRRSGYRFDVNPNGIRNEMLFQNVNQRQQNWQGIWQAESVRTEAGWTTEMRIPFKTLSFDPSSDTWGINFMRWMPRKSEWLGWVSRNRSQNPSVAGTVTGFSDLQQGMGLDVVPALSVTGHKGCASCASDSDTDPSLDVFYKLTPGLNASLTVNTDFSATEVDDRQVDLSRFSLFFPEKRDFFLADADIFEFGRIGGDIGFGQRPIFAPPTLENGRPFFSRRLGLSNAGQPVDLDYGAKLSGRAGRWNIGTLAMRQAGHGDVEATDVFVGRVAANVLSESSVGMIVTHGDPLSNLDNSLMGVDFRYQNSRLPGNRTLEGEAWFQQTDTTGLDGDDQAYGARLRSPNNRGLRGGVGVKALQRNFNPALGFVNRRGIRDQTAELGYIHRSNGLIREVYGGVDAQRIDLLTGGLQSEVLALRALELETATRERVNLIYTANREFVADAFEISEGVIIAPGEYAFDESGFDFSTGNHRVLAGGLNYRTGEFYDGSREMIRADLTWRPSVHFRSSVTYNYNDVHLPQGDFVVRLVRMQADIIFSSTVSWVNLMQYDNVSETAGFNSRLHWIPQAGRELFLVLNHSLQDFDRDNTFHSDHADLTLKFNYTFRF